MIKADEVRLFFLIENIIIRLLAILQFQVAAVLSAVLMGELEPSRTLFGTIFTYTCSIDCTEVVVIEMRMK